MTMLSERRGRGKKVVLKLEEYTKMKQEEIRILRKRMPPLPSYGRRALVS